MSLSPSRRTLLGFAVAASASGQAFARDEAAPAPYGATPSPRLMAWHRRETYAFVHFTVDTFTDREWGYGDEDPKIFNPTDFSADQIVGTAKAGGLTAVIVTAKHHDGFCLWPSAYTEHSIKNSPYKNGKGDFVGEMAEACRRHGLKFGVYLSPWDRNQATYGTPAYLTYYQNQLRELMTGYGPLCEVWFDGANGGDGYYGGARERRDIDAATYYDWPNTFKIVHDLQPDAVIFGDAKIADLRWVGNEEGYAGDPCWPTMDDRPYTQALGMSGVRGGKHWNPAEVDVSIRPGWFWHADEDEHVRSPANLLRLYFESTGRGANLLLNLPPNRRGRISDPDVRAVTEWRRWLDQTFAHNLAVGARARASSVRGGRHSRFAASHVLHPNGYWASDDSARAATLELELSGAKTFDVIRLREPLELGLRTDDFAVDIWQAGAWRSIAEHTGIGYQRLIRLDAPVTTRKVRLRIVSAAASPAISEFSLFRLPAVTEEPAIRRDRDGQVELLSSPRNLPIFYTLDGSLPSPASIRYTGPIPLADGGPVKAIAVNPATGVVSAVSTEVYDISAKGWRVVSATSAAPEAFLKEDGALIGFAGAPLELIIDLGQVRDLTGFTLTPVAELPLGAGSPADFVLWISTDGASWGEPVAKGEFANIAANRSPQTVRFASSRRGQFVRLRCTRSASGQPKIALQHFGVLTR